MSKAASVSHGLLDRDSSDKCCHARCHLLGLFWAKVRRSGVCLLSAQSGEVAGRKQKKLGSRAGLLATPGVQLERETGFEPATPTLARLCSTN